MLSPGMAAIRVLRLASFLRLAFLCVVGGLCFALGAFSRPVQYSDMVETFHEDPALDERPFTMQDHLNFLRSRELERIRDHSAVSLRSTPVDDVESDRAAYEAFVFVSDYGTFTGANKNHDHHWRK